MIRRRLFRAQETTLRALVGVEVAATPRVDAIEVARLAVFEYDIAT